MGIDLINPDQKYLIIDFETFSQLNLKFCGGYELARHKSTEVICVAYAYGTFSELAMGIHETGYYTPLVSGHPQIESLVRLERYLKDPSVTLVAHNVWFDCNILRYVFLPKFISGHVDTRWERWVDTMSLCLVLSMPGGLGMAAEALGLKAGKDTAGNKLTLKWAKPKPKKKEPKPGDTDNYLDDARRGSAKALSDLARIVDYCQRDVDVTVRFLTQLRPLSDRERKLWILTQEMNYRGFAIDRQLVDTIRNLMKLEYKRLDYEILNLTDGYVSTSNQQILKNWLQQYIPGIPNLQKNTVAVFLENPEIPEPARIALLNRQSRSQTSLAKFPTIVNSSRHSGRVFGGVIHHKASTGRWQGVLVNPLNLPRGISNRSKDAEPGKALEQAIDTIKEGDLTQIKQIYGDPLTLFSHVLRGVIVPGKGKKFHSADYSQIEARVCAWLCDNHRVLEIFRDGSRDLYREAAANIFGGKASDYSKDSNERFMGKEQELGCIYQMGWKRFMNSLAEKGKPISESLAQRVIYVFRQKNPQVVRMWDDLNRAAMAAVQRPGREFYAAKCMFYKDGDFLFCRLPSGRELAYQGPKILVNKRQGGWDGPALFYWSINPRTKKREFTSTYGGKLCENVTSGTARDIIAEAKMRLRESKDWDVVLSVHDEALSEIDEDTDKTIQDYVDLMTIIPDWAKGCPVKAEGWEGKRYRK